MFCQQRGKGVEVQNFYSNYVSTYMKKRKGEIHG